MTQIIKNCPYCGSPARVAFVKLSGLYDVECSHCIFKGYYASTENKAVQLWNTQAEIREGVNKHARSYRF